MSIVAGVMFIRNKRVAKGFLKLNEDSLSTCMLVSSDPIVSTAVGSNGNVHRTVIDRTCFLTGTIIDASSGNELSTNTSIGGIPRKNIIPTTDRIPILYNPADPSDAVYDSKSISNKTMGWLIIGIGVLVSLLISVYSGIIFYSDGLATATGGAAIIRSAISTR